MNKKILLLPLVVMSMVFSPFFAQEGEEQSERQHGPDELGLCLGMSEEPIQLTMCTHKRCLLSGVPLASCHGSLKCCALTGRRFIKIYKQDRYKSHFDND